MHKRVWSVMLTLVSAGWLAGSSMAKADQVILTQLVVATSSAAHGTVETKLTLLTEKPAGITREPAYKHTPKYGVLNIGDAKTNQIYVVLDASDKPNVMPTLYVDGNGDGDLTNDPPVVLALPPAPKPKPKDKTASTDSADKTKEPKKEAKPAEPAKKPGLEGRAPIVVRYNMTGRGSTVPGAIKFIIRDGEVSYTSDIVRTGTLKLGGRDYRIALVDETGTGIFNKYDHEEDEPVRVNLLVDRNDDGTFDPKKETFDVNAPFNLRGISMLIKSIDLRGQVMTIGDSPRFVKSTITVEDLKTGGDVIEFDALCTDGKQVSFPYDYKGKLVLLNFWSTSNPPSIAEIPNLVGAYTKYHEYGFEILGVNLDRGDSLQKVMDFTQQNNMPWRQVYDAGLAVTSLYGVNSLPRAYLVDGTTGKIFAVNDELRGGALAPAIEKALTALKH